MQIQKSTSNRKGWCLIEVHMPNSIECTSYLDSWGSTCQFWTVSIPSKSNPLSTGSKLRQFRIGMSTSIWGEQSPSTSVAQNFLQGWWVPVKAIRSSQIPQSPCKLNQGWTLEHPASNLQNFGKFFGPILGLITKVDHLVIKYKFLYGALMHLKSCGQSWNFCWEWSIDMKTLVKNFHYILWSCQKRVVFS